MRGIPIPTNLDIDDRLIEEAQKLGHHWTQKEVVTVDITGASGGWGGEARAYNSLKQLTCLSYTTTCPSISPPPNFTYTYPSTNNNGKLTSQTDGTTGETVTYAYDALNRLLSASTSDSVWGQSFSYDGFGNLTGTSGTGTAPSFTKTYDYKNHLGGEDANGNPSSIYLPADGSSFAATYDVENRLVATGSGAIHYSYAPGNKRVWRGVTGSSPADEVTFWSVSGQKLAAYGLSLSGSTLIATQASANLYLGGKLIKNAGGWVYADRLGSIGKFYPYGVERPSATTNGTEKFTGYFRDAETGNDYAINRYQSPGLAGRFITPDPSQGTYANPANPGRFPGTCFTHTSKAIPLTMSTASALT